MEKEKWKPVINYETHYEISNYGRIRSIPRIVKCNLKNVKSYIMNGKILKTQINKNGYEAVRVLVENKKNTLLIHQQVAKAFIKKDDKENNVVNHIDGNKRNNNVNNLEWCTQSHNMKEAYRLKLKVCKCGKGHPNHRLVNQYSKNEKFLNTWYGFHEINRILGFDYRNIWACCNGKQKTAYGYIWRYKDES